MKSQAVLLALLLSSALLVAACGGDTVRTVDEICSNGVDDDGDGLIDCEDVDDCFSAPACIEVEDEFCDNGEDDDEDGDVDCEDSDCADEPECDTPLEDCENGEDDDGDGAVDCEDDDCEFDPACEPVSEDCDNEIDDDGDGQIDCEDIDCTGEPVCAPDEDCGNGEDDDGDGFIDCEDSDCGGAPECPGTEDCDNGEDDDGDGDVDCDDEDCEDARVCLEDEDCDNGEDDDGDGDVDCDDSDCEGDPDCEDEEVCDNDEDDDGDGDIDCDDADCEGDPACELVENCGNGIDDDEDGDVDCADSDCATDPLCVEVCDDGEDNDLDGDIDCADSDCVGDDACSEDCNNGEDDDGDGLVDCMDPACDFDLDCAELCNGIDDDGDGRVDEYPIDPSVGDACYDGPADAAGVGQCEEGVIECFGGDLVCIGWVAPLEEELCDGLDNDCDGVIPDEEADEDCGTTVTPGDPTNLELETEARDVDVQINLDTTGSMGGELSTLRDTLSTYIVPEVRALLPTAAFGVSTFDDFPIAPFGNAGAGDWPFILHQRVTTDVTLVQTAIDDIINHNGADGPESGIESLYQIATGEGVTWPGASSWTPEVCEGWFPADEDGDGLTDCEDPDCYDADACVGWPNEDCGNEVDDDGDGYVDCNDPNCVGGWGCFPTTPFNCGNSRIDRDEQCDDGNRTDGDGCDSDCQRESGCGNAYVGGSEQCDDGNTDDGDGCSSTCEVEPGVCGDGDVGVGEQCDDGGTDDGDGCDSSCLLEPECGNGSLDAGETCDDGNVSDGDDCPADCLGELGGVDPFDWTEGFDDGLGHGSIGGVGFRETSIPIVVHITDHASHEADDYLSAGITAHDSTSTFDALNAIGALVIGVRTGAAARDDSPIELFPAGMVEATDAVVPVCAFDGSAARVSGACAADECCTGVDGAGVAPVGGECPLVFDAADSGAGLEESVVVGIEALTRFVTYDLTVVARDDTSDGVDALCFVDTIGISGSAGPGGDCAIDPVGIDSDGDGVVDTLTNATPRTRVTFQIEAVNEDINDVDGDGDTSETCAGAGLYGLYLDVIADGHTVVASRRLEVEIP